MTDQRILPPVPDESEARPEAGDRFSSAKKLKIDFHTHTREDPKDFIRYTAPELIDIAARKGFDALAITNHDGLLFSPALERYAAQKNLLLIPGIEITADECHIIIINPQFKPDPNGYSLTDLRHLKSDKSLVIAPHPFFHLFKSLQKNLYPLLGYIDAIESTCYHNSFLNLNKKAIRAAQEHGKPLVGNSDSHNLRQFGKTYTLVEADKSIPSIIHAVKDGRCEVRTTPLPLGTIVRILLNFMTFERMRRFIERRQ